MSGATGHTPGPWHRSDDTLVIGSNNARVARLLRGPLPPATVHENARLVSAAPDLLSACRLAVSFTQDEWGDGHVAMRALRAAIAKAEGGQP